MLLSNQKEEDMQALGHLSDLKNWVASAKPLQEESFCVGEEISQEEASKIARELNNELDGHVWINVEGVANSPEITTRIHVRMTN